MPLFEKRFREQTRIRIHLYAEPTANVNIRQAYIETNRISDRFECILHILHPDCFDGESRTELGQAIDSLYYKKLLIHEISTCYVEFLMNQNPHLKFSRCPAWFVQGIEEYFGIYFSDPYWRETGYKDYLTRAQERAYIGFDYGISVENDYLDGFVLVKFIIDEFEKYALFKILRSEQRFFGSALAQAADCNMAEFQSRFRRWLRTQAG